MIGKSIKKTCAASALPRCVTGFGHTPIHTCTSPVSEKVPTRQGACAFSQSTWKIDFTATLPFYA